MQNVIHYVSDELSIATIGLSSESTDSIIDCFNDQTHCVFRLSRQDV